MDKINPLKLYDDNKVIGGFQLRRLLFRQGHYDYVRKVVSCVLELFSQGKIKPTIDSVWAFEDVSYGPLCKIVFISEDVSYEFLCSSVT